jgi:hypothetical protein
MSLSDRWLWLAIPFIGLVWIYGWVMTDGTGLVKMNHGFGYYNYLTDAFQHHQLSLVIRPPKQLLALKDPFDPNQNCRLAMSDFSLYKGKYYLYWGPVPVLLFFWPARLIPFIPYLPEPCGGMICCTLGFAASIGLLLVLIRFFELSPPGWMVAASILNLGLGPPILYILRNSDIYHVSIASGYMCLMVALFLLFFGILGARLRPWAIFMGSVFLGFIVGSRPVGVVYAAVLFPLTWVLWQKNYDLMRNLCLLWGPFIMIMGLLGIYNYLRFDSFFNFGILYQISPGRRVTSYEWYSLNNLLEGLHKYWIAPIHFTRNFPYLGDDGQTVGILFFSPFIFFLGAAGWLNGKMKKPGLRFTVIGLALLALLELALVSWVAPGKPARYLVDFVPLFLVATNLAWLAIYQKYADHRGIRRLLAAVGVVMILYGCVVNLAWSINGHDRHYLTWNPSGYHRMEAFFNSWLRL